MKNDLRRFFELLDGVEESDEGRTFRPVQISCCRETVRAELNEILHRLKVCLQSSEDGI